MPEPAEAPAAARPAPRPLRVLRRRLIGLVIVYFFAGAASQKLVPGVDEIFPFFGWSLFSKVPNLRATTTVVFVAQDGRKLEPPVDFMTAPPSMVRGNRFIARKVIQKMGVAAERGDAAELARLRRLLEDNYFVGRLRYRLMLERYQPLDKWRTGATVEHRRLGVFDSRRPEGEG